MAHWTDPYIGLPYVIDSFDCTHLIEKVFKDECGRELQLPMERTGGVVMLSKQIADERDNYVTQVKMKEAKDFDIIIMKQNNRLNHVGVFANVNGLKCVLHNVRNVGSVVLHKIRELDKIGLTVEGVYRFKEEDDSK